MTKVCNGAAKTPLISRHRKEKTVIRAIEVTSIDMVIIG